MLLISDFFSAAFFAKMKCQHFCKQRSLTLENKMKRNKKPNIHLKIKFKNYSNHCQNFIGLVFPVVHG